MIFNTGNALLLLYLTVYLCGKLMKQMFLTITPFIGKVSDPGGEMAESDTQALKKKVSCAGIGIEIAPFPI